MHTPRHVTAPCVGHVDLGFLGDDPSVETWCQDKAIWLMVEADDQVEGLGCRGTHPAIAEPARHAAEAYYRRDLAGVRKACVDVAVAALRLQAVQPAT